MPEIVITEFIDPVGLEILEKAGHVTYEPRLWTDPAALRLAVQEADALIVRNQTPVNRDLLARSPVRVIGRLGVGLDNIDVAAARDKHIPVVVARGANAVAVAEYVLAACFHFTRQLADVSRDTRSGHWNRALGGRELYGKTLGIVGLGDIGQRLATRADALGMRVVAADPVQLPTHWAVMDAGVELLDLDRLLSVSDFVSLHVPLTPDTRHLLNAARISRMKPTAVIINTARGGVVDESALGAALRAGIISGAAVDVRETEPPGDPDPLADLSNVLLTPHISGLTAEAHQRTARMVAEDVVRILRGEPPRAAIF